MCESGVYDVGVRDSVHQLKGTNSDGSSLFTLNTVVSHSVEQDQTFEFSGVVGNG